MKKAKVFIAVFLFPLAWAGAQTYPDINGKVVFGYQGWFSCPDGAGFGSNWTHWSSGAPTGTNMQIDFYPDVTEFPTAQLCRTDMTIGGKPAYLYSPQTAAIVDRHFQWMQTYGLDGVLLQRFLIDIPGKKTTGDTVLKNVMNGANNHGRGFAIEYDISSVPADKILSQIQTDWMYLVDQMKVTIQTSYFHRNNLPVVAIWGFGISDGNHPATPAITQSVLEWFHHGAAPQYRAVIIGGVPAWWRSLNNDAFTDTAWIAVYDSFDVVQPWNVGRYNSIATSDNWLSLNLTPDNLRTKSKGKEYQPVIFPGFSWHNLTGNAVNQIPRLSGRFIWEQAINAKKSGAPMLKIAMFDEVNEGTAMFKVASRRSHAPDQGTWVTLDADGDTTLPSDWYLRMGGVITQMFHGTIPITATIPIRPGEAWTGVETAKRKNSIPGLRISHIDGGIVFMGAGLGMEIQIMDILGRPIRKLRSGYPGARWDGRDESGRRSPQGVYYARLIPALFQHLYDEVSNIQTGAENGPKARVAAIVFVVIP